MLLDKDTFTKDDLVGCCYIDVATLVAQTDEVTYRDVWMPLRNPTRSQAELKARVHIKICLRILNPLTTAAKSFNGALDGDSGDSGDAGSGVGQYSASSAVRGTTDLSASPTEDDVSQFSAGKDLPVVRRNIAAEHAPSEPRRPAKLEPEPSLGDLLRDFEKDNDENGGSGL